VQTAVFPQQPGIIPGGGPGSRADVGSRRTIYLAGAALVLLIGLGVLARLASNGAGRDDGPPAGAIGQPDPPADAPIAAPADAPIAHIPPTADHPGPGSAPPGGGPRLRVLVPAYFYPTGEGLKDWQRLGLAAAKVKVVAIANPETGPGDRLNPDYSRAIKGAHDAGVTVIGYVDTNYGGRPLAEIQADLDRWVEFYPQIGGFFLDRQSTTSRDVPIYMKIRDAARRKRKDALLINNPGTTCDEPFIAQPCADATCVFSGFEGFDAFRLPPSYGPRDPSRFAAFTYQINGSLAMRQVIQGAILKRIGYIYVSDMPRGENPWSRLPTYWDGEIEAIHGAE
jgi:hypothetical protein